MTALVRVVIGVSAAVLVGLAIGIPTGIVTTDWYARMTPIPWWGYPVWVLSSALAGALISTYFNTPTRNGRAESRKTFGGGLLSFFAVGCPVCNKLVILALGVNGALTWFAPAQPILAVASIALLAHALRSRLRALRACRRSGGPYELAY